MIYKLYVRFTDSGRWELVASSFDPNALSQLARVTRCSSFNYRIECDHKTNKLIPGNRVTLGTGHYKIVRK